MNRLITLLTVFFIGFQAKAQFAAILTDDDFIRLDNGILMLVPGYGIRGNVQWQKSNDSINWIDVDTNLPEDSLQIIPQAREVYRLKVIDGTCDPQYSDTVLVFGANTTILEYISSNISIQQLLTIGLEINDLVNGGVTVAELLETGITLHELIYAEVAIEDLLGGGIEINALLNEGITYGELLTAGVPVDTFTNWGMTYNDLLDAGVLVPELLDGELSVMDLYNDGILVGKLEKCGAEPKTLIDAGLIGSLTDIQGNSYKWVRIGNQIWMAENLAYLPKVDLPSSSSIELPLYYVYDYSGTLVEEARTTNMYLRFGALYNWPAALQACPSGWHLPDDEEWKVLEIALGMSQNYADSVGWRSDIVGGRMKETGILNWRSTDENVTNESGFAARAGGERCNDGNFYGLKFYGYWWTSSEYSENEAWDRSLYHDLLSINRHDYYKIEGMSVRCVKD